MSAGGGSNRCNYCNPDLNDLCSDSPGDNCCDPEMQCEVPFSASPASGPQSGLSGSNRCKKREGTSCTRDSDCLHSVNTPYGEGPPFSCVSGSCQQVPRAAGESCRAVGGGWPQGSTFSGPLRDDYCGDGLTCDAVTETCRGATGTDCSDDSECASPLRCRDGECTAFDCSAIAGNPCNASGLGECSRGITVCNGNQRECEPGSPTSEVCDGRDNDCDGFTDEGDELPTVGDVCEASLTSCQSGFDVPGILACRSGKLQCNVNKCNPDDPNATDCVCTGNGAAVGAGTGLPCGLPSAITCVPGQTRCVPNSACLDPAGCRRRDGSLPRNTP